jgi:hypothetical protein
MWLRLAAYSDIGILEAPTALTRIHGTNMRDLYYSDRKIGDFRQRALVFQMFFDAHAAALPGAKALARQARRSLAAQVLDAANRCFNRQEGATAAKLAAVAQEIDTSILSTTDWWRVAAKRAVGWHASKAIGSTLGALRRSSGMLRASPASRSHQA